MCARVLKKQCAACIACNAFLNTAMLMLSSVVGSMTQVTECGGQICCHMSACTNNAWQAHEYTAFKAVVLI